MLEPENIFRNSLGFGGYSMTPEPSVIQYTAPAMPREFSSALQARGRALSPPKTNAKRHLLKEETE